MRELLFDTPWWLLTIIGVIGIALFMSGNARQTKSVLRAGLAVLLFGVVLAVVSYLVDTPREKVIKGTHALVKAAVDRDKTTLNAELHPNASLAGWKRQQIIDGAVAYADQFGLKSATITGMDVQQDDPTIFTVKMRVVAQFSGKQAYFDTVPTDWELSWWEMPDGKWLLKNVAPLGSGNLSGSQLSKQYFGGS
jgi:hypothetical protein